MFEAGDKLYKLTSYSSKQWFSASIDNNALTDNFFTLFYNMELF